MTSWHRLSNKMGLEAVVEAAAAFLDKAVKPVMVGGPKLQVAKAYDAFVELADDVMLWRLAKGMFPKHHPHFVGNYWSAISTTFCAEMVESADACLFAGPIFNDYSSVRYSLLLKKEKAILVQPDRVVIAIGPVCGCVMMKDFLIALAKRLKRNTTAYENYSRIFIADRLPLKCEPSVAVRPSRGIRDEFGASIWVCFFYSVSLSPPSLFCLCLLALCSFDQRPLHRTATRILCSINGITIRMVMHAPFVRWDIISHGVNGFARAGVYYLQTAQGEKVIGAIAIPGEGNHMTYRPFDTFLEEYHAVLPSTRTLEWNFKF